MRNLRMLYPCVLMLLLIAGCRRAPAISDATYRDAVGAFYTSLAALQTSQDVLARRELDRLTQLAPQEPAGWANLGLLLLRQQQVDEALSHLIKASTLAPKSAAITRLVALARTQKGSAEEAMRDWRRAMELDPSDHKAPFAYAQELERQGGAENDANAQRILASLVDRSGNLAAELELARLAARRGDSAALAKALETLTRRATTWPADAQGRLQAARDAATRNPTAAATPLIFLKNVLIRDPEYRAAQSALTTPRSEIGEPLVRFVVLKNSDPQPAAADEQLTFTMEPRAVITAGATWAGAVWLTGDGAPTVAVAGPRELRLGTGATLPFPGGASSVPPGAFAVVSADLNSDFRSDLIAVGAGGLKIFRQRDTGGFSDVTVASGLPADVTGGALFGAWAADFDTEGDLDVIVARQEGPPVLLRNNGDGTFVSQSPFPGVSRVRGFVWADLDGEGVPDATLLDDQGNLRTFLNLRGGEFRERPVPPAFSRVAAIAAAELTGDAVMDVAGVTSAGAVMRLSNSASGAVWETAEVARLEPPGGLAVGSARLLVADIDNNGAADLIVSGASGSRLLLGEPGATFRQLPASLNFGVSAAVDLRRSGRLDLVGPIADGAQVARSQGSKAYHWQSIRPKATTATGDQRINSFGIGGEIEVRTGLHAQRQVIAAPVVHFGLGDATRAEVTRIMWPNGVLQSEFDVAADTTMSASQRLKGSCPWLFAWNGREMGFVTDFIWRSPLGLRINAQATADVLMTEDRVRVRGDQLVAKDGAYDLRVTAELWETHFFDLVSLMVIDHPKGTEVFVDERFAVPPPRLDVIVTDPVQEFSAVRDDRGVDVRDVVRTRDDRHLDFAGRGEYQGVTRDHFIEMEIPEDAPRKGPLWLVGQGWIHPTDSSVNVALAQGTHARPSGLSLSVADARGVFREVRPGLGFPAGKDKTILLDLAGLFPATGPRRLRLQTNLEVFWDRLGWGAGRPDVTVRPRRIEMQSADLRYRGFSVTEQRNASTPERPRYVLEGTSPRWRDLEGYHTRFGDVRELLLQVDDRYVIMNAGDELVMKFPEAAPPAAGTVRDFVVVGDGWEKDGDYNTTASRTVLPLPTHRTGRYAATAGRLEDDPVYLRHRADFEQYHTRYVSPDPARDALGSKIDPNHP